MATITKRGDSYRIKVSCGYDANGKLDLSRNVQSKVYPKSNISVKVP